MQLIDSHCHIPLISGIASTDEVIKNALKNQVRHMLCVCIDLVGFPKLLYLAKQYPQISASVGVHPNSELDFEVTAEQLIELGHVPEVVAIGETGLDYFHDEVNISLQKKRFQTHIQVAKTLKKPLIIHCREAKKDLIQLLKEEKAEEVGGVMHCFVEDQQTAIEAMALNFYISFSGIVTFKNAGELKNVAKDIPLDRLLIETDSPYLTPVPHRGKENQPAYVRYVAEYIADLKGISCAEVAAASTDNFQKLFGSINSL